MSDQLPAEGLLNEEQAAAYLGGLPLTTVQNLVKKRQLAHIKVTRGVIAFKREHLDEYIDAHTIHVEQTPWGLTEGSLRNIRGSRATRTGAA
jgi:excisionase family DNA binding protein